jgi:hypothetical protein
MCTSTETLAKAKSSAVRLRVAIAHRPSPPCDCLTRPTLPRPPHPIPTFVTMANAPRWGRDGGGYGCDLGETGSGMFLRGGVDGWDQVEEVEEIEGCGGAICRTYCGTWQQAWAGIKRPIRIANSVSATLRFCFA